MNVVIADFGSYSLKVARFKIEKNGPIPIDYWEELTPIKAEPQKPLTTESPADQDSNKIETRTEAQFTPQHLEIVAQYLKKNAPKDKSVFFLSECFLSSRIIHLPVKSQKKVELMIPHQLEESIPFPIEDIHLLNKYQRVYNGTDALVEFTTHKDMSALYAQLKEFDTLPQLLTSSSMLVDEFAKWFIEQTQDSELATSKCWALIDVGHTTTKIFIYQNDHLQGKHTITFGGKNLDNGIANTYKISLEEAQAYKHKNAFFLTEAQRPNANRDEVVFADVMKEETLPLVQEIKRYFVSMKVKLGLTIEFCYFTGGGQRIPNFGHFMSEQLDIPSTELPLSDCLNPRAKKMEGGQIHSFGPAILAALAHIKGNTVPNLLRGNYSTTHQDIFPLGSTVFLASRSAIFALVVMLSLFIERIFLYTDDKQVSAQVSTILRSKVLALTNKEERTYRTRLDKLAEMLEKKEKAITQEVSTLSAAARVNAAKSLAEFSRMLQANQKVDVIMFENIEGVAKATLKSADKEELKKVGEFLETTSLKIVNKKFDPTGTTLSISFDGQ